MYEFKTNPSIQDLEDISDWMTNENKTGNLRSISKAFTSNQLFLIVELHEVIGFCAFSFSKDEGEIHLIEIKENHRRDKIDVYLGQSLVEFTLNIMKEKGVKSIEIFVCPKKRESFWKKLDFVQDCSNPSKNRLIMRKNIN